MIGEKIAAAQAALNRFLFDLLGPQDEVFLYRFDSRPSSCRAGPRIAPPSRRRSARSGRRAARRSTTRSAEAVPLAQSGTRRKKALVVISDGNDTSSRTTLGDIQQRIRQSEVLVYAIGIDASTASGRAARTAADRGRQQRAGVEPAADHPGALAVSRQGADDPDRHAATASPPPPPPRRRARDHPATRRIGSTPTRSARSPTTAAAAPRSSSRRAIWIPPRPASPTS